MNNLLKEFQTSQTETFAQKKQHKKNQEFAIKKRLNSFSSSFAIKYN